jgi:hypothetical protein
VPKEIKKIFATTRNETIHEICIHNGVTVVYVTISKNLVVRSPNFIHWKIHKFARASPN